MTIMDETRLVSDKTTIPLHVIQGKNGSALEQRPYWHLLIVSGNRCMPGSKEVAICNL